MPANSSSIDYYEALIGEPSHIDVGLSDGSTLQVSRAGLGRHFVLRRLAQDIEKAPIEEKVDVLERWLSVAEVEDAHTLSLHDLLAVVFAVSELNRPRGRPAWELIDKVTDEPPRMRLSDYEGRALARFVHILARSYGWSFKDILEMSPEAALAHVQESLIDNHRDREWEYGLSEVAYSYDSASKTSKYKPFPPLDWDVALIGEGPHRPVPKEIVERYYPKGEIIDLTNRETVERTRRASSPVTDNGAP